MPEKPSVNQLTWSQAGICPACSQRLYLTVEVRTTVEIDMQPAVTGSDRPSTQAESKVVGARINHACGSRPQELPSQADSREDEDRVAVG